MAALFGPKCMKILVMGGTRFVGRPLVARLHAQGHALTLFTRGKNAVPAGVEHLCGDRSSDDGLVGCVFTHLGASSREGRKCSLRH